MFEFGLKLVCHLQNLTISHIFFGGASWLTFCKWQTTAFLYFIDN